MTEGIPTGPLWQRDKEHVLAVLETYRGLAVTMRWSLDGTPGKARVHSGVLRPWTERNPLFVVLVDDNGNHSAILVSRVMDIRAWGGAPPPRQESGPTWRERPREEQPCLNCQGKLQPAGARRPARHCGRCSCCKDKPLPMPRL